MAKKSEKAQPTGIIPYKSESLKKSNYLIGTKYRASVYEHKITYLAMMKVQHGEYKEMPDGVYVSMTPTEIKGFVDTSSGSFYDRLKETADDMTGNNMGIVDDEHERFKFITLINLATYEDGVFTIRFANELKDHLIGVTREFTLIPAEVASRFSNKFSFPLYQLLKSHCYYPAYYHGERNNVFLVSRGLSELKLDLGVVDSNVDSVKKILNKGKGTAEDYDKAVSSTKEKMYDRWIDFKHRCLDPAVDEINEVSDIHCSYDTIRAGKGGKTVGVEFTVYLEGAEKVAEPDAPRTEITDEGTIKTNLTPIEIYLHIKETYSLINEFGLNEEEAEKLCIVSNYNLDAIQDAVKALRASHSNVDNVMGFLIAAIKNGYTVVSKDGKSNGFNEFEQNEYDYDELERKLISN